MRKSHLCRSAIIQMLVYLDPTLGVSFTASLTEVLIIEVSPHVRMS